MAGEEAGRTLVRFVSFVGAGVICTAAINLYRDYERKQAREAAQIHENPTKLVNEALKS